VGLNGTRAREGAGITLATAYAGRRQENFALKQKGEKAGRIPNR